MEPWPTRSASFESSSMRCVSPQPCIGASESVLRMSRSSVPCRTCSLVLGFATGFLPNLRRSITSLLPNVNRRGRRGRDPNPLRALHHWLDWPLLALLYMADTHIVRHAHGRAQEGHDRVPHPLPARDAGAPRV